MGFSHAAKKTKQLTLEQREVIERELRNGAGANAIARAIGASGSTVTREVQRNRTVRQKKRMRGANLAVRCARYAGCQASGKACASCSTRLTTCKSCRTRNCIDHCPDFELKMCPATESWPYVCPDGCPKRARCSYPKCGYSARDADDAARERASECRSGISVTGEQLAAMDALVAPLVRKGQSFEAVWATHSEELPVCVRTAYRYQEQGILSTSNIDLPRKVRCRPRRKKEEGRDRIDRTGREFADFEALPLADKARAVQGDSVVGYARNARDILSLHVVAAGFQLYLLKGHGSASETVRLLDAMEAVLGSPGAFSAVFGVLLVDRGVEFDDWAGMERSCIEEGAARCRVFYCDPMESNQKAQAERNHERLRRILPKERSDFDLLSERDVAVCCSNVNSYPLAGRGGRCPFELAAGTVPGELLDALGVGRLAPDDVVLRPELMAHAVQL